MSVEIQDQFLTPEVYCQELLSLANVVALVESAPDMPVLTEQFCFVLFTANKMFVLAGVLLTQAW